MGSTTRDYTVPGTAIKFRRECDLNAPGDDIAWFPVRAMEDCMALCTQMNQYPSGFFGTCRSVIWVWGMARYGYQGQGMAQCFLRNNTGTRTFKPGIESAIII